MANKTISIKFEVDASELAQFSKCQKIIDDFQKSINNIGIKKSDSGLGDSFKKVAKEADKAEDSIKKVEKAQSNSSRVIKSGQKIVTDINNSYKDYNGVLRDHKVLVDKADGSTERLYRDSKGNLGTIDNLGTKVREMGEATKKATQHNGKLHESMKGLNKYQLSFADATRIATERMFQWATASNLIYGLNRTIKALVETTIELDSQMIDLQKVMSDTQATEAFESAKEAANDYAKTLTEVLDAYNSFGQMGYQGADLESMSRASALMSNVSELDMTQSAEALISTVNAFGVAATDAERIVDMFNETQNNFAISTQDLADSFTRAGATADTFGVGITELIGHTTAIKEVTRSSGSEIGNALKTIYSRITTMQPAIEAIGSAGVQVFDEQTGAVRSVSTILDELGGKWSSLNDNQKQYIAVQVAGRNQLSKFIALMDNYSTATESASASIDSFGSAAEENKKQTESLEGQINKLKSSLQILADDVGKSGFGSAFGGSIKFATTLVKGLDSTIKDLGLGWTGAFSGSLIAIGTIISKSQNLFKVLNDGSAESATRLREIASGGFGELYKKINNFSSTAGTAFASFSTVIQGVTTQLKAMVTAVLTNPFTWIAVAITGFTYIKGKIEENKQAMENLKETAKTSKEEFEDFYDSIERGNVDKFEIENFEGKLESMKESLKLAEEALDKFAEAKAKAVEDRTENGLTDASGIRGVRSLEKIRESSQSLNKTLEEMKTEYADTAKAMDVFDQKTLEAIASSGVQVNANSLANDTISEFAFNTAKLSGEVDRAKRALIEQTEQALYPQAVAYENLDDAITNTTASLESHAEIISGISNDQVTNLEQSANAYMYLMEKQREGTELNKLQQEELINVQNSLCSSLGISSDTLSENTGLVNLATEAKADYNEALNNWLSNSTNENKALLDEAEARMNATQKQLEQIEITNREAEARKLLASSGVTEESMSAQNYKTAMDIRIESIKQLKQIHGESWDSMAEKEREALAAIQDNEVAIQNYSERYTGAEKVRAEMSARKIADLEGEKTAHGNVAQAIEESSETTKTAISEEAEVSKASADSIKQDNEDIAQSESTKATAISESAKNISGSFGDISSSVTQSNKDIVGANQTIIDSFSNLNSNIKGKTSDTKNAIKELSDSFKNLSTSSEGSMNKLSGSIGNNVNKSLESLKKLVKDGIEKAKKALEEFGSSAMANSTKISSALNSIHNSTKDNLKKVADNIDDVEDAWSDLKNSMDGKTINGKIKIGFSFGGDGVESDGNGGGVLSWSKIQSEAMSKLGGTSISGQGYGSLRLTSPYGRRIDPINGRMGAFHDGIDLAGPMGTPIRARRGGTVVYAGWRGGYGNYVRIASGNGLETFYGHMSAINVRSGQSVAAGTVIGAVGSTGRSTGPHLHFGAAINGSSVNPTPFYHQGGIVQKAPRQNEVDTRLQVGEMVLTQKQQKQMFNILNTPSNRNGRGIGEDGRYNNPFTGMGGVLQYGQGGSVWDNQDNAKNYVQRTNTLMSNNEKWFGGYYATPDYKRNSLLFARKAYANGSRDEYNDQMLEAISEMENLRDAYKKFVNSQFFFANKSDWGKAWDNVSRTIAEREIEDAKNESNEWINDFEKNVKQATDSVEALMSAWDDVYNRKISESRDDYVNAYAQKMLESQKLSFAIMTEEERIESKMSDLQNKLESRAEETAELEYRLLSQQLQPRLKELEGYRKQIQNEINSTSKDLKSRGITSPVAINEATSDLRTKLDEVNKEYNELQTAISGANKQVATNKAEIEELSKQYNELEKELANIANKRDFTDIWGNVVYSTDGAVTQITEGGQLIMNTLANVKNAIAGVTNNASANVISKELDSLIKNVPSSQLSVTTSTNSSNSSSKGEKETYQADTNVIRNVTYVVQTGVALASESELREFAMIIKDMIDEENSRG